MRHGIIGVAVLWAANAWTGAWAVDFELPRVDGQAFFRLATARAQAVVVNVWDTECPPCVRELPLLQHSAQARPAVLFVGISVSGKTATRDFLAGQAIRYPQLLAPANPRALLRELGNASGAVPHTAVLRRDQSICMTHTGEVDEAWLAMALARCGAS